MWKMIIVVPLSVMMAACNLTPTKICEPKDWKLRGEIVAEKGGSVRVVDRYIKNCKDLKGQEDVRAFQLGYLKGIKQYCTYENGYDLGHNNREFRNVCPFEMAAKFENGYKIGQVDYKIKVQKLQRRSDEIEHERREQAQKELDNRKTNAFY